MILGLARQLHGSARAFAALLQGAVAQLSTEAAALGDSCSRSLSCSDHTERNLNFTDDSPNLTGSSSSKLNTSIGSSGHGSSRGDCGSSSGSGSDSSMGRSDGDSSNSSSRSRSRSSPLARSKPSMRFDSWPMNYNERSAFPRIRQAQLTSAISKAQTPEQVVELLQDSDHIDHINLSAAFTCARKRLCRTGVLPEQQPAAVQQLLQLLHAHAELLQQQCDACCLAIIMSACGHLRWKSTAELLLPEFLQDSRLQQAKPQDVANTLWAVAVLDMQLAEQQMQQLVHRFIAILHRAKPQEIAHTIAAVARMGHTLPAHQIADLLRHLQQQLPQLQQQDVAETLVACARMQYLPLPLLSALEQQPALEQQATGYRPVLQQQLPLIYDLVAAAGPKSLATIAWACGQLGYNSTLLPGVVLQQAVLLLQDSPNRFTMQDLCNLCWSAAVLNLQQYVNQVLQLATACVKAGASATEGELCQLYQVHLWLQDRKHTAADRGFVGVLVGPQRLSQRQLRMGKSSWEQAEATRRASAQDMQRSVFVALQALPADTWQHPPKLDQRTADGALSIGIAATTRSGVRLAIEVDAPSNLVQPACKHNGPTLFRNRALAARGYVVVSIPHWMWRSWRDTAQQQQYLLSKLQVAEQVALAKPAQQP